jgi:ParB-like chromosome segregation protein Spo0J
MTKQKLEPREHPIGRVEWVDPATLHSNHYNPNHVFKPEMALLKTSIIEDGWTQPIVVQRHTREIVDGFHRWTLGSRDEDIRAISGGLVPVVFVDSIDIAQQMMATVRHNRARGSHGVIAMGEIVRKLHEEGVSSEEICTRLGMEDEEVRRLAEQRSAPERIGKDSFGRGWVPVPRADGNLAKRERDKNG